VVRFSARLGNGVASELLELSARRVGRDSGYLRSTKTGALP